MIGTERRHSWLAFLYRAEEPYGAGIVEMAPDMLDGAIRGPMGEFFRRFARKTAELLGRAEVFLAALAAIMLWATLGPMYHYSDTWQLVINTATTVVTFLMVFVIQNTQNRDAKAIQLKLDELLRGVKGARTGLVRLEELTDNELKELEASFEALRLKNAENGTGSKLPDSDQTVSTE